MLNTTIVPLDGKAASESVIPAVAGIAQSTGGRLVLLTVLNPREAAAPSGSRFTLTTRKTEEAGRAYYGGATNVTAAGPVISRNDPADEEAATGEDPGAGRLGLNTLSAARLYLEQIATPLRKAGIEVDVQVVEGEAVRQIFDAIERENADTVALATHRSSAIARTFGGSVTDEVVRRSPVPVLSMHAGKDEESMPPSPQPPSTVIVPLDGSELSETAVEPAWELAETLGADIVFLRSASGPESMVWSSGDVAGAAGVQAETLEQTLNDVDGYLAGFVESTQSRDLVAEAKHGVGAASDLIIEEAEQHPGSIIVMTTHGSSGVKRALLGSVTDQVVRKSAHPVLVVGSGERGGEKES